MILKAAPIHRGRAYTLLCLWIVFILLLCGPPCIVIGQEGLRPLLTQRQPVEAQDDIVEAKRIQGSNETARQDQMRQQKGDSLGVKAWTDKRQYHRGMPILVTISNTLAAAVYAPIGQNFCTLISIQRLEVGDWVTEGSCIANGPIFFLTLLPKRTMSGAVGSMELASGTRPPLVSQPSTPGASSKDLRTLPPAQPWKPGDPIREVPRGQRPLKRQDHPFGTLTHELEAGTYRIAFGFRVGSVSGPAHTVYSESFVVSD